MGCIIEHIEGSNAVYTESDSHENSWRYLCFSFPFLLILWISTGQRFRKELSFNALNYRIDRVLESHLHRIRFTKELMEILCFSFPFLRFCWFWGFQPASPSRRSALFMKVIWDEIWRALRAWISSNQIPIRTRTHGDIQVFHFHFAILRISTGQRFRKERSIHEACIGWILEGIECFNFVQTESISPKN